MTRPDLTPAQRYGRTWLAVLALGAACWLAIAAAIALIGA